MLDKVWAPGWKEAIKLFLANEISFIAVNVFTLCKCVMVKEYFYVST